ncbi:MAG: DMT family transporter [Anaerolineales bacterium]
MSGSGLGTTDVLLIALLLTTDSLYFIFGRILHAHLAPDVSSFYIQALGVVEVGLFALLTGGPDLKVLKRHLWLFVAIGVLVGLGASITYEAITFVDPATVSMLSKTSILFGVLLGVLWLDERLTRYQMLGAGVTLVGVVLITFQPTGSRMGFGYVLVIGGALLIALHAALVKRYGQGIPMLDFLFFRLCGTSLFLLLMTTLRGSLIWPGQSFWMLLLASTIIIPLGRAVYYITLRRLSLSLHSVILALSPVTAVLWSLLLLGSSPSLQELLGGSVVIVGVLITLMTRSANPRGEFVAKGGRQQEDMPL